MSIRALRSKIQNEYLKNNIISAAEAKKIVGALSEGGLTTEEVKALEQIKAEFKDGFSGAGMRAFDKALARAPRSGDSGPAGGASVLDIQLGRDLGAMPKEFKLSEISDYQVRLALSRLDVNADGKVNARDKEKMGFSDQQWQSFAYFALLMGAKIQHTDPLPTDLSGKKICFSAVGDKAELSKWAEAMGAEVTSEVSPDLDFLVVGDSRRTGKDERATILNTLGEADITISNPGAFRIAAHSAGVTGPAPTSLSRAEYDEAVEETLKEFYTSYLKEGYEELIADAADPDEIARLKSDRRSDLAAFDASNVEPDEIMSDSIEDRYASNEPYLDSFGQPIPEDQLDVMQFYFFTDYAGIGLSKTFVFDRRTGDVVDESDIMD